MRVSEISSARLCSSREPTRNDDPHTCAASGRVRLGDRTLDMYSQRQRLVMIDAAKGLAFPATNGA
jgi:hypothetical protein